MFVALKSGVTTKALSSAGTTAKELCKVLPRNNVNKIQVAGLTRLKYRDESETLNIKPFPYHKKFYTLWDQLIFDVPNPCRVQKHTKLIVIDGPPAAGKEKLAQHLAKEFDFLYMREPNFNDLFVTHWGYDVRCLDPQLPEAARTWDIERFLHEPNHRLNGVMQMYMLMMRQKSYMDILAHILCTGQGVVTVRSPWVDTVFAKAMCKSGYISKKMLEAHTDSCSLSLDNYLKPHLVIYLDVPVDQTLKNINEKGESFERNAKAFTPKYLSDLEEHYKTDYLTYLEPFGFLLIYDWAQGGDFELVVEDIENLDFEAHIDDELKFTDWAFERGIHRHYCRLYTKLKMTVLKNMYIMRYDVPELLISGEDTEKLFNVLEELPDYKYFPGYNPEKGDKDLLFKTKFYLGKDYVTPVMEKYLERERREKELKATAATAN